MLHESPISITTLKKRSIVQKCASCNAEVELVCGAIIFGDQWYHSSCWEHKESKNV